MSESEQLLFKAIKAMNDFHTIGFEHTTARIIINQHRLRMDVFNLDFNLRLTIQHFKEEKSLAKLRSNVELFINTLNKAKGV